MAEGDVVIPCHFYDSQTWARTQVQTLTWRFDDVLDPDKLEVALLRLLSLGNWKKIGARIRTSADGGLEYHIPARFTSARPGVGFSHRAFCSKIDDDPLASTLPKCHDRLEIFDDFARFETLVRSPEAPRTISEWTETDKPALYVHVATFANATLLSLHFCHCLMDVMGLKQLCLAWCAVLEEREDEVPEVIGLEKDPFASFSVSVESAHQYVLFNQLLRGPALWLLALKMVIRGLFWPKPRARIVCIPREFFEALYSRACSEASQQEEGGFISESDVLCAWWARVVVQANRVRPSRPVTLAHFVDVRRFFSVFAGKTAYIGNAIIGVSTVTWASDLLTSSTAVAALQIRRTLQQQATSEQLQARYSTARLGLGTLVRPWNRELIALSNWNRCGLFDIDFGAAVKPCAGPPASVSGTHTAGKASFIGAIDDRRSRLLVVNNTFQVHGRDPAGNWWLRGRMMGTAWTAVESLLAKINNEHVNQKGRD